MLKRRLARLSSVLNRGGKKKTAFDGVKGMFTVHDSKAFFFTAMTMTSFGEEYWRRVWNFC